MNTLRIPFVTTALLSFAASFLSLAPLPQVLVPTAAAQNAPHFDMELTAGGDIRAGGIIRYSFRLTNNTGTVARNIRLGFQDATHGERNYALSSNLTYQVSDFPGCVFNTTQRMVTCGPLAELNPGQSLPFIIQFAISESASCTERFGFAFDIVADGFAGKWSPIISNTLGGCPDLATTKTGPTTVVRGTTATTITYTISAKNNGTATAHNVQIADHLNPTGLVTFNPAASTAGCTVAYTNVNGGDGILCTGLGDVAGGATKSVTLAFTVPASTGTCSEVTLSDVGVAISTEETTETGVNPGNNVTPAFQTKISCPVSNVDLGVTKTGPATVTRGTTLTNVVYSLTATNAGPAKATGVIVRDPIPAGLTFNAGASDAACVLVGSDVKCMNFDLDANQSRTFTVAFTLPALNAGETCSQTTIQNTANIMMPATNGSTDTNAANNQSQTVTTTVLCPQAQQACIQVIKETFDTNGNVLTPVPQFTFYLDGNQSITTDGQGRAIFQNVSVGQHTVTENIPANWTQLSVTPTNGVVQVTSGGSCATVVFKNRQVISNGSNLRIDLTDDRDPVQCSEELTYTVRLSNDTGNTQTVTLKMNLDNDVDFQSASDGGQERNGTVTWYNVTVNANSTRTFTVTTEVSDDDDVCDGDTLTSRAYVDNNSSVSDEESTRVEDEDNDEAECDDDRDNDHDGDTDYPDDQDCDSRDDDSEDEDDNGDATLTVQKFADRTEVRSGEQVYYTITIRNTSDEDVEDLEIIDLFPSNLLSVHNTNGAETVTGGIRWRISELLEGESRTITYSATVAQGLSQGTVIQNTVGARADNVDPVYANATVTVFNSFVPPQTGLSDGTGPLENTRRFLSPFSSASGAGMPAGVWTSLLLTGLAAGGWVARRYFL